MPYIRQVTISDCATPTYLAPTSVQPSNPFRRPREIGRWAGSIRFVSGGTSGPSRNTSRATSRSSVCGKCLNRRAAPQEPLILELPVHPREESGEDRIRIFDSIRFLGRTGQPQLSNLRVERVFGSDRPPRARSGSAFWSSMSLRREWTRYWARAIDIPAE